MSTLSEAEREMLAFFYEEDDEHFEARVAAVESIVAARVEAALADLWVEYLNYRLDHPCDDPDCEAELDADLEAERTTPTPEPCRWTNGGAPACSETRDERYWCEPCRERATTSQGGESA